VTIKPNLKDLSWAGVGVILLIVVILLALHYDRALDTATKTASRARRLDLVERMRVALSSASEAEKSAVMATTDQESQNFAEQSRAASAMVEQIRDELAKLLATSGTRDERDLLAEVSRTLTECQHIDHELLDLSVKNSNLKAYDLAFGPAANALASMDNALSRILEGGATSTAPEARQVLLRAAGAQSGALRILALLPPHISEESDARMDALEARMVTEDQKVRSDLKVLATLLGAGNADLETATSGYARFFELKVRILELSRQNTNVRSLIISLNQKRKAVQMCQAALDALERTIQEESLSDRRPESPR